MTSEHCQRILDDGTIFRHLGLLLSPPCLILSLLVLEVNVRVLGRGLKPMSANVEGFR